MRVHLKTLGCRLNEAELETWAQQLQNEGHHIVQGEDDADLVILNSCAVTADAVRKSRHMIRRIHRENPRAKLVVSGCYATLNHDEVAESLGVDLVIGNADKPRLLEIAREKLALETMPAFSTEPGETSLFTLGRQRAFVKVQDGCRYRCSFCIVTVARGQETSRPVAEIVSEINQLQAQGIQEVILTGVHLGGWGSELNLRLHHLVEAVLAQTQIPRLRLGSLEPWELSEKFFSLLQNPRVMPHLHLPLQSGADPVLRRMARRCKTAEFAELVAQVRRVQPDLNLTTDIIVGFPGETDDEWRQSLDFIDAMAFGHIHIFAYSPRPGTKAANLPEPVSEPVKKARAQVLQRLAEVHRQANLRRFLGRSFPVLWENGQETLACGSRVFHGYTPNYLRVETLAPPGCELSNRIETVLLKSVASSGDRILGERLKAEHAP